LRDLGLGIGIGVGVVVFIAEDGLLHLLEEVKVALVLDATLLVETKIGVAVDVEETTIVGDTNPEPVHKHLSVGRAGKRLSNPEGDSVHDSSE
jgi:hypothetical protein